MTPEEAEQAQSRIERFNQGSRDLIRFGKILTMLNEMPKGDHEIGEIVINLKEMKVGYRGRNKDHTSSICSLDRNDHEPLIVAFIQWATCFFVDKEASAKKEMDNA